MKSAFSQFLGWLWVAAVMYLYIAQNSPSLRPSGLLGDLLSAFYDAMTASYLH